MLWHIPIPDGRRDVLLTMIRSLSTCRLRQELERPGQAVSAYGVPITRQAVAMTPSAAVKLARRAALELSRIVGGGRSARILVVDAHADLA